MKARRRSRSPVIRPAQLVRIKTNLARRAVGRSTNSPAGHDGRLPVARLKGDLMKCNKSRVNANPGWYILRIIQFISKRSRRVAKRRHPGPGVACTHIQMRYTRACVYTRRVSRNVPFKIARKVPDPRPNAGDHDFSDRDMRLDQAWSSRTFADESPLPGSRARRRVTRRTGVIKARWENRCVSEPR